MKIDPLERPNREITFELLADRTFLDSGLSDMDDFHRAMEIFDMLDDGNSTARNISDQLVALADSVARSCPNKLQTFFAHTKMDKLARAGFDAFDDHAIKNNWPNDESVKMTRISTDKIMGKET